MKLCTAVSDGAGEILDVQERCHSVASGVCHKKVLVTAVTRLGHYGFWQPGPDFLGARIMVLNLSLSRGCKSKYKSRERD